MKHKRKIFHKKGTSQMAYSLFFQIQCQYSLTKQEDFFASFTTLEKKLLLAVRTAFLITLILFGIYSLRYNQQLRQAQSQYRSLQKKAIQRSPPQTISKKQNYSKKKYQKRTVTIPNIDFPLLWKYNSDIYARTK